MGSVNYDDTRMTFSNYALSFFPDEGTTILDYQVNKRGYREEVLALKHESRILGQSSNPVCGFSVMEQVRLCTVWTMENWLGYSLNQIQGFTTVRKSYPRTL